MNRIYGVCPRPSIFVHMDFWSQPSRPAQSEFWKEIGTSDLSLRPFFLNIMFVFFLTLQSMDFVGFLLSRLGPNNNFEGMWGGEDCGKEIVSVNRAYMIVLVGQFWPSMQVTVSVLAPWWSLSNLSAPRDMSSQLRGYSCQNPHSPLGVTFALCCRAPTLAIPGRSHLFCCGWVKLWALSNDTGSSKWRRWTLWSRCALLYFPVYSKGRKQTPKEHVQAVFLLGICWLLKLVKW